MATPSKTPRKWAVKAGFLGLTLCALCCALPMIGILAGTGLLTSIAIYAENLAVVMLIGSVGLFAIWAYKRKQSRSVCSVDCSCKTDESKSTNNTK